MHMTTFNHLFLWAIYLAGSAAALHAFWQFTRWPRIWWLSSFVRMVALVLLLTPVQQSEGGTTWAPALITAVFDELQGIGDGWFRAGINLMVALLLGLVAWIVHLVLSLVHRRRRKKRA